MILRARVYLWKHQWRIKGERAGVGKENIQTSMPASTAGVIPDKVEREGRIM